MNRVDAEVSAAALQREGVPATIVGSQYRPGTWLVIADADTNRRKVFQSRSSVEEYVKRIQAEVRSVGSSGG